MLRYNKTKYVLLAWLLLPHLVTFTHCENYDMFLKQFLTATCPFTQFCTMGPSRSFLSTKTIPCCLPCSCESDCTRTGTCCPDFSHLQTLPPPDIPCLLPSRKIHVEDDVKFFWMKYGITAYYTIITCLPGYRDEGVKEKCLKPSLGIGTGNIFVSDRNGHVYRNAYCAKCNGVETVTMWTLQMVCKSEIHGVDITDTWQALASQEDCSVLFVPPNETTKQSVAPLRCFSPTIDSCNATGEWKTFDNNVKRACEAVGTTYNFMVVRGDRGVYKNVFCFLCNGRQIVNNQCPLDHSHLDRGIIADSSFTAILDNVYVPSARSGPSATNSGSVTTKCFTHEIYDHHLNKCRVLRCPLMSLPIDGKCQVVYSRINGLIIGFFIRANYPNITALLENGSQYFQHREEIVRHIIGQLNMEAKGCRICDTILYVQEECGCIMMYFMVETADGCQPSIVVESLHRWKNKKQKLILSGVKIQLEMAYWESKDIHRILENVGVSVILASPRYICKLDVALQELFYCPHVDIPTADYELLTNSRFRGVGRVDFELVQSNTESFGLYRICVDRYLAPIENHGVRSCQMNVEFVLQVLFMYAYVSML